MKFEEFKEKYEKVRVEEYPNKVLEKPIVSVCVVTFQHVNFIKQCLDGILMQETNFDFEILLGDDASTDGTREICIEYAEKYPDKIKLFLHHRENNIIIGGSPTGRFNLVYNLFSAKGKYIALCEGDDYWTDPKKLQKQVDFLEENEKYVICSHSTTVHNKPAKKNNKVNLSDGDFKSVLLHGFLQDTLSVVFRNIIKELPPWFFECKNGDYSLYLILLEQGGKVKYLSDIMGVYRQHDGGVWSSLSKEEMGWKGIETMKTANKGFGYKYNSLFKDAIAYRSWRFNLKKYNLLSLFRGEVSLDFFVKYYKNKLVKIVRNRNE